MANVTISEQDSAVIELAINATDTMLQHLEQLAQTGRPIRRDDILHPQVRAAIDAAKRVEFTVSMPASVRRKK